MRIDKIILAVLKRRIARGNVKRNAKYEKYMDNYERILDLPYIDDGVLEHKMDVFYTDKKRKNICVIDIHGGAYIVGQHRDNFVFVNEMLKFGYDAITIDYAPNKGDRHTKDLIDDCYKAIQYIYSHKEQLKLENDKFVIIGDSAGGHFALILAIASCDEQYAKELGYDFKDISFKAVLANCPVVDFVNIGKGYLSKTGFKYMFGPEYLNEDKNALISPRAHLKKLTIPLFLSTCKNDFLRNEALCAKKIVDKMDIPFMFIDINTNKKEVAHVHNMLRPDLEESKYVNAEMCNFILEHS